MEYSHAKHEVNTHLAITLVHKRMHENMKTLIKNMKCHESSERRDESKTGRERYQPIKAIK